LGEDVKLNDFDNAAKKSLEKALRADIAKKRPRIREAVKLIITDAIYNCPEMESLRADTLKYDFGLTSDPSWPIALSIADTMRLRYIITDVYVGGFEITVQPGKYENLYALTEAYQTTENGAFLPWLKWLLEFGDAIIIANFGVKYTNSGRTGGAIMVENRSSFRVDPRYSGVQGDNFITRALNKVTPEIQNKAWQIFTS
jgi:hypothetical protein